MCHRKTPSMAGFKQKPDKFVSGSKQTAGVVKTDYFIASTSSPVKVTKT